MAFHVDNPSKKGPIMSQQNEADVQCGNAYHATGPVMIVAVWLVAQVSTLFSGFAELWMKRNVT